MNKTAIPLIAAVLALLAGAIRADAKPYLATLRGDLTNQFGGTCASNLGDAYDSFCPSGACGCLQYDDNEKSRFSGNVIGKRKGPHASLHFTHDGGAATGDSGKRGPGCQPVYGEIELPGSKDVETLYFAGSLCEPQGNRGKESMTGGWSINSSSHGIKGFGTLTGSFGFFTNSLFSMKLVGQTQ